MFGGLQTVTCGVLWSWESDLWSSNTDLRSSRSDLRHSGRAVSFNNASAITAVTAPILCIGAERRWAR